MVIQKIFASLRKAYLKLDDLPILQWFLCALIVTVLTETLSRHSFFSTVRFLCRFPLRFGLNLAIVGALTGIALFFKRRTFVRLLTTLLWTALGTTNCILLFFRRSPLAAIDFRLIKSVIHIVDNYFNIFEMIGIILMIAGAIFALVMVYIRTRKSPRRLIIASVIMAVCLAVSVSSILWLCRPESKRENFANLSVVYGDYGFSTCFMISVVDIGIDEPPEYSPKTMEEIAAAIDEVEVTAPDVLPNILFVQLESFYDVAHLNDVTVSSDPVPFFNSLMQTYPGGFLSVPSVGAGTANTEFEIISQMNIDFFGAGEYPYETVLQKEVCETVCHILKPLGYSTHAIHDNDGTFYDRNTVFSHFGFDTFTSMEYMQDVVFNPTGWADDSVLTGTIFDVLTSTEGRDMIYTISVQGHGKYPREYLDGVEYPYRAEGIANDNLRAAFEYYLTQLHEMDEFVREFVTALEDFDEPTVVVFYGDHLPNFDIETEDIDTTNLFQTEYVVWNNIGLSMKTRDVEAYQLASEILSRVGIVDGIMPRTHARFASESDYQEVLELLEYDMLYGDKDIFGGENPYEATDMQMGVKPITITSVTMEEDHVRVLGENFTPWSVGVLNGRERVTTFVNSNEILIRVPRRTGTGDEISVAQIGADGYRLSETTPVPLP